MLKKAASFVHASLRGFVKLEAYLVNRDAKYERRFMANDARHSLSPSWATTLNIQQGILAPWQVFPFSSARSNAGIFQETAKLF
jgi:hypothetical protein